MFTVNEILFKDELVEVLAQHMFNVYRQYIESPKSFLLIFSNNYISTRTIWPFSENIFLDYRQVPDLVWILSGQSGPPVSCLTDLFRYFPRKQLLAYAHNKQAVHYEFDLFEPSESEIIASKIWWWELKRGR